MPNGTIDSIDYNHLAVWKSKDYRDSCSTIISSVEEVVKEEQEKFMVYPNPTTGNLILQLSSSTKNAFHLSLHNSAGKRLYTTIFTNQLHQLDLTDYPSGFYIIKVTDKTQVWTKKVIKQ